MVGGEHERNRDSEQADRDVAISCGVAEDAWKVAADGEEDEARRARGLRLRSA
jgi:hypothetical protein